MKLNNAKRLQMNFYILFTVRLDRIYLAETENWKYCNKIIFKCVNNVVRPIFNEKVAEIIVNPWHKLITFLGFTVYFPYIYIYIYIYKAN